MTGVPEWWQRPRDIAVVVDTPGWFDEHAEALVAEIRGCGDNAVLLRDAKDIENPDVAFYLSCMKITPSEVLARARVNLVAHASALPKGRGFSPVVWQILEGAREIPIRLILAAEPVDSGEIVLCCSLLLEGHELNGEIRARLGEKIVVMCLEYLSANAPAAARPQEGAPSWYARRRPEDSRLDPKRSIADQFDLLRVVDNKRYPAFFDLQGHRYILQIAKAEPDREDSRPDQDDR